MSGATHAPVPVPVQAQPPAAPGHTSDTDPRIDVTSAQESSTSAPSAGQLKLAHSRTQSLPHLAPQTHVGQSPSSFPNTDRPSTPVVMPNGDTVIATPSGTVRVRPYVSAGKEVKALLQFTPRHSVFDRENVKSQRDEFRGFFTLFWLGLALFFVRTSLQSWDENRTVLSLDFGRLITRDMFFLAVADGTMLLSMILCVPFVKCIVNGYFNYHWAGVAIQHTFQTVFLAVAIAWGYARDWYWVQAGFLVLHAMSCMMKMHSYMSHNGMLSTVYKRLQQEKRTLKEYIDSLPGGLDGALAEAAEHKAELEAREASAPQISVPGTPGTPASYSDVGRSVSDSLARLDRDTDATPSATAATSTAVESLKRDVHKRHRSTKPATDALPSPERDLPRGTSLEPSHEKSPHTPRPPAALSWSSDHKIALLCRNIDDMEDELRSNGERGLVWPENVTYKHFLEFMCFPTLVYELEYPRTKSIRPLYVLEKVFATFGTFSLIYTVTEHYIMPFTPKPGDSIARSFANLAIPMMINFLLIFYIIFECVCAGFAELSYFADREFYQDWWNSTSWDQFARKWNKPVHTFLLRHVYASSRSGMGLSRWAATFFTFFLSALCHELVMAVVSKKIRPYLFLLQMIQVPLIALGRIPIVKRNPTLGNIVFWIGLTFGFPVLEICYLVY